MIADEEGRQIDYTYDALDRLVTITYEDPDAGGPLPAPVTQFGYSAVGLVTSQILTSDAPSPAAIETRYEYDGRLRLQRVIEAFDDGNDDAVVDQDIITSFTYDQAGNLIAVTDPLGRAVQYDYDLASRPIRITEPDPDAGGSLVAPVTYLTYDGLGRLARERDPRGSLTRYHYDQRDRITRIDAPEEATTQFEYDPRGLLEKLIDPLGRTTEYTYDEAGRLTNVLLPPADSGQPTADSLTYQYDTVNNLRFVTDPLDHTTEYQYDERYRLVSEIDANGDSTFYRYNLAGDLEELEDAVGNVTTWGYDPLGRVVTETNELLDIRSYEYDEFDRLVKMTDRNGRVSEYDYDNLHRLTEERWLDGMSTVGTISYTYDKASQMTQVSDSFATYDYTYDNLGRATTITADLAGLTDDVILAQAFDAGSIRTQLAATIGSTADFVNDYTYDALGRMTRVEQNGTGVAEKRVDFTYNAASQFESISRYADLNGTEFVADSMFEYDGRGRLVGLVHSQNTTTFADYEWTYDAADRLTGFTNSQYFAENVTYSYDDRGQLTGADRTGTSNDESYTYDENGNRTSGGFTPGANNQLTTDGTYNYTYDDEGNLIKRTKISDGSYTDYEWDHRNRLVSVTDKSSGGTQTQKVTYGYDAFNRLVERTYQTTSGGPVTEGYFIYDGIQMILQLDDSADVEHRLLWGPAVDQALADETGVGDVYWYLTDHLGTVRDVVEYDDGTNTTSLANHIVFDSFGRRISETNASLGAFDVGYTGKWLDRDTGLAWHWNRWYNPGIQRWMSEDPILSDANSYRYVGNMTTTYVDPNGLEGQSVIGQFGLGLAQGGANIANGVQDAGIGVVNLVNNLNPIIIGIEWYYDTDLTIPSPDWSRDLCVRESDLAHAFSKFAGGEGVIALGTGGLTAAARALSFARAGSRASRLVHLTDEAGRAGISASRRIIGRHGIFAISDDVAQQSRAVRVLRTGLPPSRTHHAIPIPESAGGLFRRPVPIGPYSAWKCVGGVTYASPGILNIGSGAFRNTATLIGPDELIYVVDVGTYVVGGAVGQIEVQLQDER